MEYLTGTGRYSGNLGFIRDGDEDWAEALLELGYRDPYQIARIIDSANKSAKEWEASLKNLPPGVRVATIRPVASIKAKQNGWNKNYRVTKKNSREIYVDNRGTYWGLDTEKGRWEKFNKRTGKHEGEYNFDNEFIENSIVPNRKIQL